MNWRRAHENEQCGRCGHTIAPGAPLAELTAAKLKRCRMCAGVEPPADLPEAPATTDAPAAQRGGPVPFSRLSEIALPFDGRAAAAGRDEE